MCKNKKILAAALVAAALSGSRMVSAETITVTNSFQDPAIGEYQYLVTLDGEAYVQHGDGFVLYDWGGLVTTGPDAPSFQLLTGPTGTFNNFAISQQLTGNGLTDAGGSTTAAAVANSSAMQAASDNSIQFDNNAVENITFSWSDGLYDARSTGPATAILTLYSTLLPSEAPSVYGSADRSGTTPGTSYGHAASSIFAPNYAPLPAGWMGGTALFALVGLVRTIRSRRLA